MAADAATAAVAGPASREAWAFSGAVTGVSSPADPAAWAGAGAGAGTTTGGAGGAGLP